MLTAVYGPMAESARILASLSYNHCSHQHRCRRRNIFILTCELGRWSAYEADPYGILEVLGELPEAMRQLGLGRPTGRGVAHRTHGGPRYPIKPRGPICPMDLEFPDRAGRALGASPS